jgi:hypothetical protein
MALSGWYAYCTINLHVSFSNSASSHLPLVSHINAWIPHHHLVVPTMPLYGLPHVTLSMVTCGLYKFHVIV